jgi:hypothetical protein
MCLVYTSGIEKLITYETEYAIKLKKVYVNDAYILNLDNVNDCLSDTS